MELADLGIGQLSISEIAVSKPLALGMLLLSTGAPLILGP